MKNAIKHIGFIAAVAVALFGCAKDNVETPVETGLTHTVKFHAGTPTRTIINEGVSSATFKWSSDDASRFYLTETGVAGTGITISTDDDYETITLSATFTHDGTPAEYTYAGFLSKNYTDKKYPKIPAAQTSTSTSYDPNADVLVAKSATFGSAQDDISLQFARPAVINKMTIKGLDEGETISSIVVSADKNITGYYNTSSNTWNGQSSEITISTDQTVPASGQITVYFVTMPVEDVTLTLTVTTGNYIYSKTFASTIDFVQNQVTTFGVNSLTKNSKSDYSGTYVLTNVAGTKMAGAWADGNNIPAVDVTLDGGTIYYDPDVLTIANAQITLAKITDSESAYYGMYTMEQNGLYLYAASSSNNYLKGEDTPDVNAYWEVSCTDGNWSIVASKSSNNNVMQYNGTNVLFSCYSSASQTAVALYGITANVKPTPVITASASIALSSDAVSVATSTGVSFNSNTATVTAAAYSNAACTVASTWLSVSTSGSGNSTVVNYTAIANDSGAERTEYIKITATNSAARSVSKVIPVTQQAAGAPILQYTLEVAATGNNSTPHNSYTAAATTTINEVGWSVMGNSSMVPWRIGGKNLDGEDREIYSTTPISANISQIVFTHGTASSITVNSMTVIVSKNADFGSPVSTLTPSFVADGTVTVNRPDGKDWSNCYYKIVYNVSVTGNTNRFLQFTEAKFYSTN